MNIHKFPYVKNHVFNFDFLINKLKNTASENGSRNRYKSKLPGSASFTSPISAAEIVERLRAGGSCILSWPEEFRHFIQWCRYNPDTDTIQGTIPLRENSSYQVSWIIYIEITGNAGTVSYKII